ncbi:MAG TPA: hypothetical protein VHU90_03280 [Galbitalea sp.]|nr:hypothetical protein [Galbitalea sp.]
MKRILRTRTALATAAGLSLVGALAGCASTTSASSSTDGTSAASGTTATSTSDDSSTYKDGTYSADGSYVSPGGQEEIAVTLTVKNDLITAVSVRTVAADAEATQYEAQFASGISAVAVGKDLGALSVGTVAGSSLTSHGFDVALAAIRSKAQAS